MPEQAVALEGLDDRRDAVVATDAQVVALADVVGEDHARVLPHAAEYRQQHVALERLRLVDDHERVVQRAAADVGERHDLEQSAGDDLLQDVARDDRPEGVEDRLTPRVHLLGLVAGQVAELLPADGEQRPEDDDLLLLLPLQHRFQTRAQRERALAGAGASPEGHDADLGVQQQVDRDALLGRPAVQPEHVAVAADQAVLAVAGDAPEGRPPLGVDDEAGVHGQSLDLLTGGDLALVEIADLVARHVDLGDARPAAVDGLLGEVFLRVDAEGCGLHAHRQILGDDGDLLPLLREMHGDGEDARVVVAQPHAGGQHRRVGVGELDPQGAAVADGHREVQAAVLHAQLVEVAQRLTGEVADLGVVPLALELGHHHDRDDDGMLREPEEGPGIAQQDRRVQHVGAEVLIGVVRVVPLDLPLLLWCSCGHNPLPPRGSHPEISSRP